jgi:hypothetical protein
VAYQPIPIPPDYSKPDIRLGQLMWLLNCSERTGRRVVESGKIEVYKLNGILNIVLASAEAYRAQLIAEGLRPSNPPPTGKRRVGRPRKAEASAEFIEGWKRRKAEVSA